MSRDILVDPKPVWGSVLLASSDEAKDVAKIFYKAQDTFPQTKNYPVSNDSATLRTLPYTNTERTPSHGKCKKQARQ